MDWYNSTNTRPNISVRENDGSREGGRTESVLQAELSLSQHAGRISDRFTTVAGSIFIASAAGTAGQVLVQGLSCP